MYCNVVCSKPCRQIAATDDFLIPAGCISNKLVIIHDKHPANVKRYPAYSILLPALVMFINAKPVLIAGNALPHSAQVSSAKKTNPAGLVNIFSAFISVFKPNIFLKYYIQLCLNSILKENLPGTDLSDPKPMCRTPLCMHFRLLLVL